ncbi:MAG: MraY family glycosyltransferase [Candidatus Omnitrophota bacterium]|nr:MraY family glycosyltransferase [Candidatus Omnitrophota bacterium]
MSETILMPVIETFFISAACSYLLTPFVRALAVKLNYFDHPQDNKVHAHPVPLLGGLAIFAAFVIAVITKSQAIAYPQARAILFGASILVVIGLIDDRMGMMPNIKLLGQFLSAMVVVKAGIRLEFIGNYYISVLLTYVWIIGITNAFNLLDNMNGLSSGIAAIAALFFGAISFMSGQFAVSIISFALAGSSIGFLKHNFPKASLFMGDAGSLVLGFVLASIAIMGSWKTPMLTSAIMIPILILGYPIFDTALVSVMRIIEGRSIFQGGKDHSSHRLALLGLKRYKTVVLIYFICALMGITAVSVTRLKGAQGLMLTFLAFICMLALGIRLSLVDTKRNGRKKGVNAPD